MANYKSSGQQDPVLFSGECLMEMRDADDVGWDHSGEGGQQKDNERGDATTLIKLWGNF